MGDTTNVDGASRIDGARRALRGPVDVAPLVFFRIAFGVLLAWHLLDYLQYGWARRVYVDPVLRVPHGGFEWLAPWPGDGMLLHFAALLAAAVAFALGRWTRLASWALFVGLTYTFLLERTHSNNHDYLIVLLAFLACWLPLGRAGSRDVRAEPSRAVDEVPAWTLWLLRGQVAVLYLFGALSKWNADWLQQGEPFGPHVLAIAEAQGWPFAEALTGREAWVALSWAGMLFDLLVVPGLFWRRTRAAAVVASVLFHGLNQVLFPIGIFPMLALALTVLFLDPAWSRRVLRLGAPASPPRRWSPPVRVQPLVLPALGLWFSIQLIVPLRPWVLSDEPAWTERGTLYSWRMMISSKDCELDFVVTAGDPPHGLAPAAHGRPIRHPRREPRAHRVVRAGAAVQGRGSGARRRRRPSERVLRPQRSALPAARGPRGGPRPRRWLGLDRAAGRRRWTLIPNSERRAVRRGDSGSWARASQGGHGHRDPRSAVSFSGP